MSADGPRSPFAFELQSSTEELMIGMVQELTQVVELPNREIFQERLDSIGSTQDLVRFLHRFVLFNDALAARVCYLAGLIHLSPELFLDPELGTGYLARRNALVSAFIVAAARDEYSLSGNLSLIHQNLSQAFLKGAIHHFGVDSSRFDSDHPVPPVLERLLVEARVVFFEREAADIYAALGFHIGLELFAHEEFSLLDSYLRTAQPALVDSLSPDGNPYSWISQHTVVELEHHAAAMNGLRAALHFHPTRGGVPEAASRAVCGFRRFVALQANYYRNVLADDASSERGAPP